jgi:Rha family phage regulatory protein
MQLVTNDSNNLITTSKVIADAFGKEHRNILKRIGEIDCSDKFRALHFERSTYLSAQNKELECYTITRDGFSFLCMGFTGKKAAEWKEKYISAFNSMEQSLFTIENRMNQLSKTHTEIKDAGSKWSRMGHEISKAKKENKRLSSELVKEIQTELEF